MFYTYLLRDKNGTFYIGYTKDLRRRVKEHFEGKTFTTKKMKDPRLVYYEAYNKEFSAKEREMKLKQFGSSYHGLIKRLNLGR